MFFPWKSIVVEDEEDVMNENIFWVYGYLN